MLLCVFVYACALSRHCRTYVANNIKDDLIAFRVKVKKIKRTAAAATIAVNKQTHMNKNVTTSSFHSGNKTHIWVYVYNSATAATIAATMAVAEAMMATA